MVAGPISARRFDSKEVFILVGDKSTFAIECELRATIDTFYYCNFRFWIAGEPIGDWEEQSVLGVLMHSSDVFMRFQGARQSEVGNSMSSELLWQHINLKNAVAPIQTGCK